MATMEEHKGEVVVEDEVDEGTPPSEEVTLDQAAKARAMIQALKARYKDKISADEIATTVKIQRAIEFLETEQQKPARKSKRNKQKKKTTEPVERVSVQNKALEAAFLMDAMQRVDALKPSKSAPVVTQAQRDKSERALEAKHQLQLEEVNSQRLAAKQLAAGKPNDPSVTLEEKEKMTLTELLTENRLSTKATPKEIKAERHRMKQEKMDELVKQHKIQYEASKAAGSAAARDRQQRDMQLVTLQAEWSIQTMGLTQKGRADYHAERVSSRINWFTQVVHYYSRKWHREAYNDFVYGVRKVNPETGQPMQLTDKITGMPLMDERGEQPLLAREAPNQLIYLEVVIPSEVVLRHYKTLRLVVYARSVQSMQDRLNAISSKSSKTAEERRGIEFMTNFIREARTIDPRTAFAYHIQLHCDPVARGDAPLIKHGHGLCYRTDGDDLAKVTAMGPLKMKPPFCATCGELILIQADKIKSCVFTTGVCTPTSTEEKDEAKRKQVARFCSPSCKNTHTCKEHPESPFAQKAKLKLEKRKLKTASNRAEASLEKVKATAAPTDPVAAEARATQIAKLRRVLKRARQEIQMLDNSTHFSGASHLFEEEDKTESDEEEKKE